MHTELLTNLHDRESFTSEEPELNDFLRLHGLDIDYGHTWVLIERSGSTEIIAFYTLDPDPQIGILEDPYYEHPTGVVALRALAVDKRFARNGIGTDLLKEMVNKVLRSATEHSISIIMAEALNERSKEWCLGRNLGFKELSPNSMWMYISFSEIMKLLS